MYSPLDTSATPKGFSPPTARTVLEDLSSVEWDFPDRRKGLAVHDIHPYPARFIWEIPSNLIRLFHPGDNSAVFDPFCGSGTTLVEAGLRGIPSVGVDVHPLAVLIARVKVTPLRESLLTLAETLTDRAVDKPAPIPSIPRLDHWFKRDVQEALARLTAQIRRVRSRPLRDALSVALSRIVVRVSNQESDTRYAAVDKAVSGGTVFELFAKSAALVQEALEQRFGGLFAGPSASSAVLNRDVLFLSAREVPGEVGLVVTSPPYPNAYEYWLYHKYRMYWLGMDPLKVREREIGARPHYFKKNHQTEVDFERQMGRTFHLLREVLPPGRFACFLVGRSVIHGREIDNAALLARAGAKNGFRSAGMIHRRIPSTRKAFNPSNGGIDTEAIVILQRDR